MKLWQYGTIIVLMIGVWLIGDIAGYNAGYDEGYVWGYTEGAFDGGWHAAYTLNSGYTNQWNESFYQVNGTWFFRSPDGNDTYHIDSYNGIYWQAENYNRGE